MELIAYQIHDVPEFQIEPASNTRAWMDATEGRFAYRCLPLVMANQFGWIVRCPITFEVYWNGEGIPGRGLVFNFDDPDSHLANYVQDHFGDGILTFSIPYLFRTPPEYGLIVRGPTNAWVNGAAPLDGFVETGWLESTFTMNWKLTEANKVVRFDKGFPICMLQPYPKALLEDVQTKLIPLDANPELKAAHEKWASGRDTFNRNPERKATEWQKDYFQGKTQAGDRVQGHLTRLKLGEFSRDLG
jgi:hypothetical protein